jgi:hypothetical protein
MSPPPLVGPIARNPFFSLFANNSDFVLATGHGSEDEMTLQDESLLWKIGSYDPAQVRGKVINLVSCNCGAELGPDLVKNGARAFLGFDQDLLWIADPADYFTPWSDSDAATCMRPIIQSINSLLDGATCAESLAIEKAGFLANAANTDFELMRALLEYDHDHAVLFGDASATIEKRPHVILPWGPPPLLF